MVEPLPRQVAPSADDLAVPRLGLSTRPLSWRARWPRWEPLVAVIAVVGAIAAVWTTLDARFLQYPGWLAVQKADFIVGPIGVGLYWMHRRPKNRLGLLLIVLGLLGVLYVLESSTNPTLFRIGVLTEDPIWVMTTVLILAFPSGRLDGLPERLVIAFNIGIAVVTTTVFLPHIAPGFTISNCRALCPGVRAGEISFTDSWLVRDHVLAALPVVLALATAGVIAWRFVAGTRPRRRALAIGAPIALLFLFSEAAYRGLFVFAPNGLTGNGRPLQDILQWSLAATRSFVWYGFLFALIAAELFAGRVLRNVVRRSLERPSLRELEGMLRGPLGDPGLRLGFWRPSTEDWVGHEQAVLQPPGPRQAMTVVDRDGRPAVAIVHDAQLSEDPELVQAAGAAALLAQENAELEAAWRDSLRELTESRARLASASERERRKLERDLHDGAQQHLVAASINLTLADEADDEPALHDRIADSRTEIEQALSELREISHGIYPTALARSGLSRAFERLARHYPRLTVSEAAVGRFLPEIELAAYYCGLEAVQNAAKHAGPRTHIRIRLYVEADQLHLEVRDNGRGFDLDRVRDGVGLQNMRDRLGAVGGHVDINSEPGNGTLVTAVAPLTTPSRDPAAEPSQTRHAPGGIR